MCPQMPRKCCVTTVVGPPVELPKIPSPTDAEVQVYLDKYTAALQRLFDEYKPKYSPDSAPLVII